MCQTWVLSSQLKMQKYKDILREIKKVFPGAQHVSLVIHTNTSDRIMMQADVEKVMIALDATEDAFKESDTRSLRLANKTMDSAQLSFDGSIFVTDKSK